MSKRKSNWTYPKSSCWCSSPVLRLLLSPLFINGDAILYLDLSANPGSYAWSCLSGKSHILFISKSCLLYLPSVSRIHLTVAFLFQDSVISHQHYRKALLLVSLLLSCPAMLDSQIVSKKDLLKCSWIMSVLCASPLMPSHLISYQSYRQTFPMTCPLSCYFPFSSCNLASCSLHTTSPHQLHCFFKPHQACAYFRALSGCPLVLEPFP